MIVTQLYLVVSGNYAWLNWLTIVAAAAALPDFFLAPFLDFAPTFDPQPAWFAVAVIGLAILVAVLSYWPVRNLIGPRQMMNASFNPYHIVNTYGAFGSVTRHRDEVVVEGTEDKPPTPSSTWHEYEFKGKPGDPMRMPRQWAPYHLRLDWMMWFLPFGLGYAEGWFIRFVERLLQNDPLILGLLRRNPFAARPPGTIRAGMYRYRYTSWKERRDTGAFWVRQRIGEYLPPVTLNDG
jgi:hypothetical protein